MEYVEKSICDEFYDRAGLKDPNYIPRFYHCGFAANNQQNCNWDNGMVMVSNSSGTWVLIGLGIRGPGCSTPSRFIEMYRYQAWIEQATSNVDYMDFRKSAFNKGFANKEENKDIPVHQFHQSISDMENNNRTANVTATKFKGPLTLGKTSPTEEKESFLLD